MKKSILSIHWSYIESVQIGSSTSFDILFKFFYSLWTVSIAEELLFMHLNLNNYKLWNNYDITKKLLILFIWKKIILRFHGHWTKEAMISQPTTRKTLSKSIVMHFYEQMPKCILLWMIPYSSIEFLNLNGFKIDFPTAKAHDFICRAIKMIFLIKHLIYIFVINKKSHVILLFYLLIC